MARRTLYPEGSTALNVILPTPLKEALDAAASEETIPTSTLVVRIFREWAKEKELVSAS